MPVISVVTVVYNGLKDIERTIRSVLEQTYENVQYIIVDGGSTDGTLAVIDRYRDRIHRIISEPDNGIYDAMNKGIRGSTGDYLYFLNAGDAFCSSTTLSRLAEFAAMHGGEGTILHGDVVIDSRSLARIGQKKVTRLRLLRKTICHQAALHHRGLFEKVGLFDSNFRLKGDHEWYVRALPVARFTRVDIPVAFYDPSGVSSRELGVMQRERKAIIEKYARRWERVALSGLKLMRGVKRAYIKA